jgi:hypothetical protein
MRAAIAILAVAGCASSSALTEVRFHNAPAVQVVDDRHHVAKPPAVDDPLLPVYYYDGYFQRRISRALELRRPERARGVNAFDEVPDSTWFTNRIGVREVSLDEIRSGPVIIGSPEPHRPFTIRSRKSGGRSLGFAITDARGEEFLLKFDRLGAPEMETAAEVIVGRLLWACGYNVPETHVVHLDASDLRLAPDATTKDELGHKQPLTQRDLDALLTKIERTPDGRIRAMASHVIDGKAIGGHPGEGVRRDDPNDLIPHELRRDLRGTYALFAWLDHNDVKQHNSLDLWIKDPTDPTRHYVKHYLLDFGKTLGVTAAVSGDLRQAYEYVVDLRAIVRSLVSGGLRQRLWEERAVPTLRGVGMFDAQAFDPAAWKPLSPAYTPFLLADRFDHFWGAKLAMRFSREQLHAAVETARLSDPRAVEYLTDTLVARQRATARHWFSRVNPLDQFAVSANGAGTTLCFEDLLLVYDLQPVAQVSRYAITTHDRHGRRLAARHEVVAGPGGRACTQPLALATDGDGYTIVRVETQRPGFTGATDVHVARDPGTPGFRVVGIWRL